MTVLPLASVELSLVTLTYSEALEHLPADPFPWLECQLLRHSACGCTGCRPCSKMPRCVHPAVGLLHDALYSPHWPTSPGMRLHSRARQCLASVVLLCSASADCAVEIVSLPVSDACVPPFPALQRLQ